MISYAQIVTRLLDDSNSELWTKIIETLRDLSRLIRFRFDVAADCLPHRRTIINMLHTLFHHSRFKSVNAKGQKVRRVEFSLFLPFFSLRSPTQKREFEFAACIHDCVHVWRIFFGMSEIRGHVLKFITLWGIWSKLKTQKSAQSTDLRPQRTSIMTSCWILQCASSVQSFGSSRVALEGSIIYHFGRFLKFIIAFCLPFFPPFASFDRHNGNLKLFDSSSSQLSIRDCIRKLSHNELLAKLAKTRLYNERQTTEDNYVAWHRITSGHYRHLQVPRDARWKVAKNWPNRRHLSFLFSSSSSGVRR